MKNEIVIRFQDRPQAPDLHRLFLQTSWASDRGLEDIQGLIDSLDVFVCAYEADVLIGFARALSDGKYRALIDDVVVDSGLRKKGVGKLIVSSLMEQLGHIDEVYLNAESKLEEFYKKFGFKRFCGLTMLYEKQAA